MGRCLKKFAKIAQLPRTFDEQSFYSIVYEGAANSTAGRLCDQNLGDLLLQKGIMLPSWIGMTVKFQVQMWQHCRQHLFHLGLQAAH